MINTRDLNPRVLTKDSRDMQYIFTMLDFVVNSLHLDIKYFINLINPSKCSSSWLKYVGSLVGYKYMDELTPDQNRFIILNYKSLLRLRGSQAGIEMCVSMYLNLIGRTDTNFRVTIPTIDSDDMIVGHIYIDDEDLDLSKIPLLSKMIEWVRPLGVSYTVRKTSGVTYDSKMYLDDVIDIYSMKYPVNIVVVDGKEENISRNEVADSSAPYNEDNKKDTISYFDKDKNLINPDNVVGHSVVSDGEDSDI